MAFKFIDDRQIVNRSILQQLFPNVGSQTLDILMSSINQDLTVPLNVTASNPASLAINVGPAIVSNSESSRQKSISFIGSSLPNSFSGTTVTFPPSSGGSITTGQGQSATLTLPSGDYVAILLALNNVGTVVLTVGNPVSSISDVIVPAPTVETEPFSYVILYNAGGTIQNIAQNNIYQLVGGSSSGSSSSAPTVTVLTYYTTPFTADVAAENDILSSVSSFSGLQVGMGISGTDIASGAYITALNPGSSTITMSANAISGGTQASLVLQDLTYTAVAYGTSGNSISVAYTTGATPTYASLVLQDLTYTAVAAGAAGNSVSVAYTAGAMPVAATLTLQNIVYTAVTPGASGNAISVAYTTGGTAGSEVVTVTGNAISVQIDSGVSTASQILTAIEASAPASALVIGTTSSGGTAQTAPAIGDLSGGENAAFVSVVGDAITVQIESGVTPASQILSAIQASTPASDLVSVAVSGVGSNPETAPASGDLSGGDDNITVSVTGNAISVQIDSGVSTATAVYNAVEASSQALALIAPTISGTGSHTETAPASGDLSGGAFTTVTVTPTGSGVYTPPAGVVYLEVEMVGGGGGGSGGSNTFNGGNASNGGSTIFGTSLLVANGGSGATNSGANDSGIGGAGGTATIDIGATGFTVNGGSGSGGGFNAGITDSPVGGVGGNSFFGGSGGAGTAQSANGYSAAPNSGSGGGGGTSSLGNPGESGGGGGSGGYVDAIITSLIGSYTYSIGSGGPGGSAGTQGTAGGNGGSGVIIVMEYYN